MRTELASLHTLISEDADRAQRARAAAEWIRRARGFRWVGIYDVHPEEISAIAWTGDEPPAFPTFSRTKGLSGAAVASGEPVISQDTANDPRYLTAFGTTRSEAIYPLRAREGGPVIGTLDVESDRPNAFTEEDQSFLAECALVVAGMWSAADARSENVAAKTARSNE